MITNSGAYAVGTEVFSIVDESRKEVLGDAKGNRKITIRMYYPVNKSDVLNKTKAKIFSDRKASALSKAYHIRDFSKFPNEADYYDNAQPLKNKKFPLIIYNHGYNAYVECNTFLCCELASNGYIVASVGHAYEAIENDYQDGSFDYYDKSLNKKVTTPYIPAVFAQMKILNKKLDNRQAYNAFDAFQRKYCSFLMKRSEEWGKDTAAALVEIKKRYGEITDFSNGIAATGHSFGGSTAYWLCQYNDEVSCGINIDGALFGEYSGMTMKKPFYQIGCKENLNVETKPFLDTTAPVYYTQFKYMKHIGFTDAKFFVTMKMLVGKLDPMEMYGKLVKCHLNFFDKYMKNKDITLDDKVDI
ncbi:MAG: hypothetical protein ACI4XP_00995 [Acutalibacteraceae bacterium]